MLLLRIFSSVVLALLLISCQTPSEPVSLGGDKEINTLAKTHSHATGSIQFVRLNNKGKQDTEKLTFAEFNAHEAKDNRPSKGSFYYRVYGLDNSLHREIEVDLYDVLINPDVNKGWFVGTVVFDTKGCGGNGQGGHDSGCDSGGCSGDDNGDHSDGCTGHDTGHDSGCTGDDDTDHSDGCSGSDGTDHSGGCSGSDGTDHSGGCSGSDGTDHSDGCSGSDGTDHSDGCSGSGDTGHSGGGHSQGTHIKGKNCRLGQVLAFKVHDVATPGAAGDGITWKWFDPADPVALNLTTDDISLWPHLCKKTIIEGNLSLHY